MVNAYQFLGENMAMELKTCEAQMRNLISKLACSETSQQQKILPPLCGVLFQGFPSDVCQGLLLPSLKTQPAKGQSATTVSDQEELTVPGKGWKVKRFSWMGQDFSH